MANKTAMVSIRIVSDANNKGFRAAADGARRMSAAFGKALPKMTAVAAAAGGVAGAVGNLGLGLVSVGALAGAALLPVVLGFEGIKAAAGSASEGFNQLKSVSSSALQSSMVPGFEALNGFMLNISGDVKNLATVVGQSFSSIAQHIASPEITNGFASLLVASADFVEGATSGINELITGFAALGPALAPVATDLGRAFGDMIGSIGRGISELANSGALTQLAAGFASVMTGIGDVVEPLIVALGQAGAAIGPGLGAALSSLGTAVGALAGPLTQIAGVVGEQLAVAFAALAPAVGPIGEAFAALVSAVAPLVGPLAQVAAVLGTALAGAVSAVAPLLAQIGQQLGTVLTSALNALAPVLPVIVSAIGQLAAALMPAIPPLAQVAQALFPALAGVLSAVAPILPIIVNAFMQLVVALMPAIPPLAQLAQALFPALAAIITAVAPLVAQLAGVVVQLIAAFVPLIGPLTQVAMALLPAFVGVVQIAAAVLSPLIGIVGRVAGILAGVLVGAISSAMSWFQRIADAISSVVSWVNNLIGALGRIHWPKPPSWLGSMFGSGDNPGLMLAAADSNQIAYGRFAAGGLVGMLGQAPSNPAPATTVNITVNGALDPRAVAEQIRGILRDDDRARGLGVAAGRGVAWA